MSASGRCKQRDGRLVQRRERNKKKGRTGSAPVTPLARPGLVRGPGSERRAGRRPCIPAEMDGHQACRPARRLRLGRSSDPGRCKQRDGRLERRRERTEKKQGRPGSTPVTALARPGLVRGPGSERRAGRRPPLVDGIWMITTGETRAWVA